MLSLRGRHVDKEQTLGHMEQYFVIVEPKKVSQVLEKKVFSLHGLQSAWSAFWVDPVIGTCPLPIPYTNLNLMQQTDCF